MLAASTPLAPTPTSTRASTPPCPSNATTGMRSHALAMEGVAGADTGAPSPTGRAPAGKSSPLASQLSVLHRTSPGSVPAPLPPQHTSLDPVCAPVSQLRRENSAVGSPRLLNNSHAFNLAVGPGSSSGPESGTSRSSLSSQPLLTTQAPYASQTCLGGSSNSSRRGFANGTIAAQALPSRRSSGASDSVAGSPRTTNTSMSASSCSMSHDAGCSGRSSDNCTQLAPDVQAVAEAAGTAEDPVHEVALGVNAFKVDTSALAELLGSAAAQESVGGTDLPVWLCAGLDAARASRDQAAKAVAEAYASGVPCDPEDMALLADTEALLGARLTSSSSSSQGTPGQAAPEAEGAQDGGDASAPAPASKHLWLGNLNPKLPRAVLKAVFEHFGAVEDVVTFPGRMYAFVNYKDSLDATRAADALNGKEVGEARLGEQGAFPTLPAVLRLLGYAALCLPRPSTCLGELFRI